MQLLNISKRICTLPGREKKVRKVYRPHTVPVNIKMLGPYKNKLSTAQNREQPHPILDLEMQCHCCVYRPSSGNAVLVACTITRIRHCPRYGT